MRLRDKVAIVTGANRGIGLAITHRFAAEGARVVVACRKAEEAERLAAELNASGASAMPQTCDITSVDDCRGLVERVVDESGRIDVLCNNAAVGLLRSVTDTSTDEYSYIMDTNVRGAFMLCKFAIPVMCEQGGGSIVNLASVASFVGFRDDAAYCASKGAVLMLTKQMALDYADRGIRVNAVCPGFIDTPELRHYVEQQSDPKAALEECISLHPIGRVGNPEEVAAAALFLASDEASFITGASLAVDGGLLTH